MCAGATASVAQTSSDALRVFIDCDRCDFDYLRREIPFVNYVRDRKDAELHILVTTQPTGSGGVEYIFRFIGLQRFAGVDDELRFTAQQTDTRDERRQGYTRVLKLGLVRYVTSTAPGENLQLVYRPPAESQPPTPASDPWNYWVFRLRGSGSINGEERNSARNVSTSMAINRTTEAWKISLFGSLHNRKNRFTLSDGEELTDSSYNHRASALVVKSLTRHWSAAVRTGVSASTFLNQDRAVRGSAGIEYNVFPYDESSRRQLTMQLTVGVTHFDYMETTIFGKDTEVASNAVFLSSFDVRQPWGSSGVSFEASSYFHDYDRHRLVVDGEIDVRLFRGFSLNMDASGSRVRDQLYLRAGEATDEEILLRRRQLATSYRYRFAIGLSYTFGSIFNNIVNPRFRQTR